MIHCIRLLTWVLAVVVLRRCQCESIHTLFHVVSFFFDHLVSLFLVLGVYRFDGNPFQEFGPLIVGSKTLGQLTDGVPVHTEGKIVSTRSQTEVLDIYAKGCGHSHRTPATTVKILDRPFRALT